MNDPLIFERAERFLLLIRHCQTLSMRVHEANAQGLTLHLPYSEKIIGNPDTRGIHGGAITTLLDTTCGASVLCVLPELEICPTLDLRIDYMHSAEPERDVYGFAESYRVTSNVIFTRGYAFQDNPREPIAHVVGAFMRMGKNMQPRTGDAV